MSSGNDKNSTTAGLGVVWLDGGTGTDTLTIDYSTVSGPIVYGTYYDWNYLTDEAFSTIYYKNYEFLNITGGSDADNLYGTSPRRLSENTNKNLAVRFFRPFIYSRTVNQPTKAKYILYKQYVMV